MMTIVGFVVSIICVVVICLIVRFENLRKKKSNQLLVNLCVGHLLSGMVYVYGIVSISPIGRYRLAGNMYSTLALVFLSVDRFILIQYPYQYQTKIYNRIHVGFMLFSPLVYIVYFLDGLILQIENRKESFAGSFVFVFSTTVLIMFFLNISIYITICKQRKRIRRQCKHLLIKRDDKDSTNSTSTNPTSTTSTSTHLAPTKSSPTNSTPRSSSPTNSTTTNSPPENSTPTYSTPTNSSPTNSSPANSTPAKSSPTNSTPTNSTPTSSSPTNSTTTNSPPKNSTTTYPAPTNSSPTNSTPSVTSDSERRMIIEEIRSFYLCFGCVITFILLMTPSILMRVLHNAAKYHCRLPV